MATASRIFHTNCSCSTGSAVSSWSLDTNGTGSFSFNQDILFNLSQPGPNAARQDAPHEHEAILDPTGQYILVPDLGADLVRVFCFDDDGILVEHAPLKVVPGSGPRHAAFYNPYGVACENCTSFLYVVTELANTVTGYAVTYPPQGGLSFKQVYTSSVYGNLTLPSGNAAAEIAVSVSASDTLQCSYSMQVLTTYQPDNRFLVISNRNNTSFQIANPDTTNSTKIASDSLSTFELHQNGSLAFKQLWPAGGSYPRQFSMNRVGDLIAVGLQYSSAVVIMARDVPSGLIGKPVARAEIDGQVTCVVWDQ